MCEHSWVPYVMAAAHPKQIIDGAFYYETNQVHFLVTTKIKCVACGEVRDLPLDEPEQEAIGFC